MHTIEYFPFHSPRFNVNKNIKEKWLNRLTSTTLSINFIKECSAKQLVKHILGIGKPWVEVLSKYTEHFTLIDRKRLIGPNGGKSHEIFKFKPTDFPDALPIVIYSGPSTKLPAGDRGVDARKIIREFLELE